MLFTTFPIFAEEEPDDTLPLMISEDNYDDYVDNRIPPPVTDVAAPNVVPVFVVVFREELLAEIRDYLLKLSYAVVDYY